ncbi:class I mannose-6-phosphate isomerase [Oscillospiraceae bacterium OttesenSCG-928-F05]|nr:class I mannose-6-phosphate isomerase [Oscillospiraceae bacterium OttesenSCG-928-F05]
MFVLEPIFHYAIWGGDRLKPFYGERAAGLAHLYALWCKKDKSNVILNGVHAGERLVDIIGEYPLTLAIVDAKDDLSIQVHPLGAEAKREAYYFLEAPECGYIYNGVTTDKKSVFASAAKANATMTLVNRVAVSDHDYIYVAPGTLHAMTAGSLVYEIEEGSDKTYRIYDYDRVDHDGRQRELHVEQALDVLDVALVSGAGRYPESGEIREETFSTQLMQNMTEYTNTGDRLACLTVLRGCPVVDDINMTCGMAVILEPGESVRSDETIDCIAAKFLI